MPTQAITLVLLAALAAAPLRAEQPKVDIGKKIDNFTLRDFHGQPKSLDEIGKGKVVVLAFLGVECPLAKLYAPRLVELAKQYEPKGVAIVGIVFYRDAAVTEIASFARVH